MGNAYAIILWERGFRQPSVLADCVLVFMRPQTPVVRGVR